MNLNFGPDKQGNDILMNKEGYLFNLFTMIENGFFEGKMNRHVINIIKKTDKELLKMGFTSDDLIQIRIKTSEENLRQNGFDIKDLCIFDISKDRKEFIVKIMNLLENGEKSEKLDYISNIFDFYKVKLGLEMSDLDLLEGAYKGAKNEINK